MMLSLMSVRAFGIGIMVNEFNVGTGGIVNGTKMSSNEYIEFVITQTTTAAQLASLTFGDTNNGTSRLNAAFTFDQTTLNSVLASSGVSAFQAGTVIVVKGAGLGAQNLTYAPTATNFGNADAWSIELVAGQGAIDSPSNIVNGNLGSGSSGEVIWVSSHVPTTNTDTSGFISALGYDNAPGTIANAAMTDFGASSILRTTVTAGTAVSNSGSGTPTATASLAATMGTANDAANSTWITTTLRANSAVALAPEPARASMMILGVCLMMTRRRRKGGAQ